MLALRRGDWIVARPAQKFTVVSRQLPRLVNFHRIHCSMMYFESATDRSTALARGLAIRTRGALDNLNLDGFREVAAVHHFAFSIAKNPPLGASMVIIASACAGLTPLKPTRIGGGMGIYWSTDRQRCRQNS